MNMRASLVAASLGALVAGLTVGATPATAAPEQPSQAASARQCGFDYGVISSSWVNCTSHNYRVVVNYWNNYERPGSMTICAPPGRTNLAAATGAIGYIVFAKKLNDERCSV